MKIDRNNYEAFLLDYIEGNLSAENTAELMLFLEQNPDIETGLDDFKIISLEKDEPKFESKRELKRKEFVVNDDLIEGLIISYVNGDLSKTEEKKLLEIINDNKAYSQMLLQYQLTRLKSGNEKIGDKVLLKGHLPINNDNAEYFIIAESEGVLSEDEKKALNEYKKNFPGIKELAAAYSSTKLDAEEKIIFENKSLLKKKEGVVISFYAVLRYTTVAAAACLILYFGFFRESDSSQPETTAKKQIEKVNAEEKNIASNENLEEESEEINPVQEENAIAFNDENPAPVKNNSSKENKTENKTQSPVLKEPVLDNFAQEEFKNQSPQNESYVMMEKEIITEVENKDEYALAANTNKNLSSINEDDFITPGQYVRNWAKKTFFTEEAENKYNDNTTELADNNTLRLKGTNATIQNKEDKEFKEYGFSLGKFSFKRKVRK